MITALEPTETVLATITFRPWFDDENPPDQARWAITIEYLDQQLPDGKWLERQFCGTIRDAAKQIVAQILVPKPEGAAVRSSMESLCHQLGQWWATPDHGAYSVDWLCGYFAGQRA